MADASRRVLADGRRVVPSAAEAVNALDVKARGFMPTRHTGTEGPMSVEEALDPKNKNMTLGEIWRRIGPSEAEQEKARKKEKREKLFAAISDGISALSNLFFTTRYAPNMYDAKNSAQKKANDKWKQYWKDLDDDRKDKFDLIWKVKSYDDNKGYQDWKRARDEKRDAADAELEKAKAQRDKENDDLDRRLKLGKISEQEHKAKKAEVEARYAEQQQKAEIARKNRSGRGGGSRGGSGSRGGGYGYGGSGGGSDMDDAYAYWMSLTDEEKNQYRDWNKRGRRVKTGQKGRVATYGTQYMDDDDDFIKQVWEQRKAYLHNNGREDEIPSGGYNIDFRQRHSNDLTRGGRGRGGVKKSAI